LLVQKSSLKSQFGLHPAEISPRGSKSPNVKSQSLEKKPLTTLAVPTVIATPAFAKSFNPNNVTGNIVLSLGSKPAAPMSDKITVHYSGIRAYAMVPRRRSAHVTRR
jgi:hypothetical protein